MSLAATMQAACIDRVGGPIRIAALPVPRPGPTDVLVRVAASGVNHVDLFVRSGASVQSPRSILGTTRTKFGALKASHLH